MINTESLVKYVGVYSKSQDAFHVEQLSETVNIGVQNVFGTLTTDYILVTPMCDTVEDVDASIKSLRESQKKVVCGHEHATGRKYGRGGTQLVFCSECGKILGPEVLE